MEKQMELKTFPTLCCSLDDLTNQLERRDRVNGIYDSLENLEICFNSLERNINFDEVYTQYLTTKLCKKPSVLWTLA